MSEQPKLPVAIETQNGALAPLPYGPDDVEGGGRSGPGMKRMLLAVLRYKWLVVLLVAAGTTAAVIASRYVSLRYSASASVWIERGAGGMGVAPIQTGQLLQSDAWVDLIRSFVVVDHVVRDQALFVTYSPRDTAVMSGLRTDSVYRPGDYRLVVDERGRSVSLRTREGAVIETVQVGDSIGRRLGFRWQPDARDLQPKREVAFTVTVFRDAATQLLNRLQTPLAKNGQFLRVRYSADNPRLAAGVVNATVDRFIEVAAEIKKVKLEELTRILQSQLDLAWANLQEAEYALENFLVQTITLPTEPTTPVPASDATRSSIVAAFFTTKIQVDQLQRDREAIERVLARGDSVSLDALSIVPSAQQSPEFAAALGELAQKRATVRALRRQYTDEYDGVKAALQEVEELERRVIPQLGRQLINELRNRESSLQAQVASSSSELQAIPPRAIEQGRLQRAVASADRLYTDLRQRVENAQLASASSVPDISVLDHAVVPRRPELDQRMKLVMIGFLGSLGFGVGLALLLDRVDPRLRYAEQVTDELGLPIVGAVPNLAKSRKMIGSGPGGPQVLEALRSIRLGLMHAYGSAGPLMVTITSPGSGDGKTFLSSNLGLTFADLGMKTLVIDGDTRRGTLHRMFDLERKPGLTDYLGGVADMDAVIYRTRFPLVDVIPCGSRRGNAPELLSSPAMGDLLARIRADYQVILIDSPPLGAGVDPLVLGALAGNMLLVLRTGVTDRTVTGAKLKMLERLPIRLLGTVLNGYDSAESYRYYSYMPGYEASSEEPDEPADMLQPA